MRLLNYITYVLPLAILTSLGQHPRFEIYGTDYSTEDGTAIRDYRASLRAGKRAPVIRVVSPAVEPLKPTKPWTILLALPALALAVLLGVTLAFSIELLGVRLRTIADVERTLEVRVLATLPRTPAGPPEDWSASPEKSVRSSQ